jgi:uncharacterized protein
VRDRYEPGEFCWAGLATSDPGEATAFYTALFGWEAEELTLGEATYTELFVDGKNVAILYRQTEAGRAAPPHWTAYVSVQDAAASAARAGELGGKVLREPTDVVEAGRVAAVRDPLGAILSLWQPEPHPGAELTDEVGALIWNELATPGTEGAKSFYGDLLGWEFEAQEGGYTTIRNAGRLNGGIRDGRPAYWYPYFAVESAEAAQADAEQAGGRTVLPPSDNPFGRFAVLSDPQDAAFGVFESASGP